MQFNRVVKFHNFLYVCYRQSCNNTHSWSSPDSSHFPLSSHGYMCQKQKDVQLKKFMKNSNAAKLDFPGTRDKNETGGQNYCIILLNLYACFIWEFCFAPYDKNKMKSNLIVQITSVSGRIFWALVLTNDKFEGVKQQLRQKNCQLIVDYFQWPPVPMYIF